MARLKKAVARQVMWHAIAYHAKKQAERDALPVMSEQACQISLEATIGGVKLREQIDGALTVSPEVTTSSSTGLPPAEVIAWLCEQIGSDTAAKLTAKLEAEFARKRKLSVDDDTVSAADALLKRLRNKTSATKLGPVRYAPAA